MQKHNVWSIYTRVFHWSLVVCFLLPYITDDFFHASFGMAFLVLVVWRIIFGFSSVKYTKFSDFTFSGIDGIKEYMKNVLKSLKTRAKFDEKTKVPGGHNVASSYGTVVILVGGIIVSIIGFSMYAVQQGFIKVADEESVIDNIKEVHEIAATLVFLFILAHIAGILLEKYRGGEAINSMIDGKKEEAEFDVEVTTFWKNFAILGYVVAILAFIYVA